MTSSPLPVLVTVTLCGWLRPAGAGPPPGGWVGGAPPPPPATRGGPPPPGGGVGGGGRVGRGAPPPAPPYPVVEAIGDVQVRRRGGIECHTIREVKIGLARV